MPPKRSGEAAAGESNSKKAKVSTDDLEASLSSLYKRCVPHENQPPREDQLLDAEERGELSQLVWPFLVEKHGQKKSKGNDILWFHGCHLLALLVSLHCREGTFPASTPLSFLHDGEERQQSSSSEEEKDEETRRNKNMVVLEDAVETLVYHDQKGFRFQTTVIHFVLIANTCCDQTLRVCNPGLLLWKWMPERRRELEFKRHAILQKKFAAITKTTGGDDDKEKKQQPFLVLLLSKIVHLLEGETDGHGKRLLRLVDSLQEKEQEDEEKDNNREEQDGDGEESGSSSVKLEKAASSEIWTFVHRSLELLIDLLSNHETRQYLVVYMDAMHFAVRCRLAVGNRNATFEPLRLAQQLLQRINRLISLLPLETSITATTTTTAQGSNLSLANLKSLSPTPVDIVSFHHRRATALQKMCHRHYPHLKDVIYAGVGLLCNNNNNHRYNNSTADGNAKYIRRVLGGLKEGQLDELLHRLRLVDSKTSEDVTEERDDEFLWHVLLEYLTIPPHPLEQLKSFPLYPTERVLWDHNLIPPTHLAMRGCGPVLSLPKLNKRFLSYQDYLLRNFELVRLESAYEIRSDLVDVIKRLRPVVRQSMDIEQDEDIVLKTEFRGWARMALELDAVVEIKRVDPPMLGNVFPAQVVAEFTIDLQPCGDSIRREWDQLSEFDNLFLVTVDASKMTGASAPAMRDFYREHHQKPFSERDLDRRVPDEEDSTFPERFGVTAVRGCMLLQVRDEQGNVLSDPNFKESPSSTKRIFRVALDPAQFVIDRKMGTELYAMMNLVVRRKGNENNFKSVLETIRGLMDGVASISRVMPSWLQTILLGLGDPTSASYKSNTVRSYARKTVGVANPDAPLDFGDTFLDEKHLREGFADVATKITVDGRLQLPADTENNSSKRQNYRIKFAEGSSSIEAASYPFASDASGNPVRFTRPQVEAIRSGLNPGLTLIVGPPGTGKTDVAVQIIASLYHSFPAQRTVIITHSNAALNDIFQKVMSRGDIPERYMVRLGSGERDLETTSSHDFSKPGRVAFSLHQRSKLLEQVQVLSESLGVSTNAERGKDGSSAYTCETAEYFNVDHVQKRIRLFEKNLALTGEKESAELEVTGIFPFASYFEIGESQQVTLSQARESFDKLNQMFAELAEYRPLELLNSQRRRVDYLIMKQARIVAMTCTHAAIARSHLIDIGFEYDNVVMEEAGQMLDIETFIPLLLQRGESDESSRNSAGVSRLKRVCLMGDHHQLPPVVKNMAFSKFSNLDQSLFSRLIRLGVPYVQLDKQGRARAEIASLYSWRYKNLGNLDHVQQSNEFQLANSGFVHTFQLINVDDFEGKGESSPTAYFYQNVGEAEFAVALFQYMVLIGHNPDRITILTTYNGQKALIQDILAQRCGDGTPLAGMRPAAVSTVDKYQGQQNDIVLLSLVRTLHVGHIRDIRRLVVAVSRSRLGLYVFCRKSLFAKCHELKRTLDQLMARPNKLQLVLGESHPTERKVEDEIPSDKVFEVEDVSHLGSMVHSMQEELINNSQMETVGANAVDQPAEEEEKGDE